MHPNNPWMEIMSVVQSSLGNFLIANTNFNQLITVPGISMENRNMIRTKPERGRIIDDFYKESPHIKLFTNTRFNGSQWHEFALRH